MTVNLEIPSVAYIGDGVITTFAFVFTVSGDSSLVVTVDATEQIENVDYSVENVTEFGGDVEFFVAPADQSTILIQRKTPMTQQIDLEPFTEFPANTLEGGLDKLQKQIQEFHGGVLDGSGSPFNIVLSVFGRIGNVIALALDYLAIQIGYENTTSGLAATDVQAALDEIDANSDTHLADTSNPHAVSHAQTTGKTPNDHHNQAHLLNGPDHSDVEVTIAAIRDLLAWREADDKFALEKRMNWRNVWQAGTYYEQDVVLDGRYTMVANTTTTDPAAPIDNGLPAWDMPDVPAFATQSNTSLVGSGHTYLFSEAAYINSVRVWVPVTGAGIFYRLTILTGGVYTSLDLLALTAGQWNVVVVAPRLVLTGAELLFYLESANTGGSSQVTGGWTRDVNSNANEPLSESWNRNNAGTVLRIDFDDLNSTDRQSELEGIIVGSTIVMSETAIPSNFTEFQVLANPVTGVSSVSYLVAITDSGAADPTIGETCTMTADIPIAQSTDYSEIVNGWVGNEPVYADVTSFLAFDGVDQGVDPDNQYGISINVQRIIFSPDWDVMALSG